MPGPAAPPARSQNGRPAPVVPVVPFTSAAHEHVEQFMDVTVTPGAATNNITPQDIPSYGYLRNVNLQVTATGGTLGAGVLSADYPWNFFQSVNLIDVNGGNLYGPLDGYAALQTNIWGAYAGRPDPRVLPNYVSTINAMFFLRVPVEISHRDGFGALANQSSAANYRLNLTTNPSTVLYSTAPTTIPAFRILGWLEAWSLPEAQDMAGRPQADVPPMLGTTQYWSYFTEDTSAGANTVRMPRQGNLIRAVVVIARTAAGVRQDNVFADPATFNWDGRNLQQQVSQAAIIQQMAEKVPDLSARDTGVFAYLFNHADHNMIGDDTPTLWLPTVQGTRQELQGSAVTAGTWQILTNDVAPAEVVPTERYVETSRTGFQPVIGGVQQ